MRESENKVLNTKTKRRKFGWLALLNGRIIQIFVLNYNPVKHIGVDGKKIFQCILKKIDINTGNSVESAQDRDGWSALGNTALNLQVQ